MIVDQIIAYENGELTHDEVVTLFQELVDSGAIYSLQGSYQRIASDLIESGEVNVSV